MNPDKRDQFAERWIEEVLARYSDAEPRPGLDSRIFANLEAAGEHAPRHWSWRLAWIPVACAALVAVTVGIVVMRQPRKIPAVAGSSPVPPVASAKITEQPHADVPVTEIGQSEGRVRRVRTTAKSRISVAHAEPRRQEFPSASALSEQERLLLVYARVTPPEELLTIVQQQERRGKELERLSETKGLTDEPLPESNTLPQRNAPDLELRNIR